MEKNPWSERYNNNNDLFVHVRLGDIYGKYSLITKYYINGIKSVKFDKLYISSDSPDNEVIAELKDQYPNAVIFVKSPVETLQFGSTCKNVLLSHGSFSAIIGYLAFFSDVFYPETVTCQWCPMELFRNKGFNPIEVDV
jgi:hypothetical protein